MMDLMVGAGTVMSTRRLTEELSRRWGIPADHLGRDTTDATTDDVVIEDVWADSGSVTPGSLFACVPGRRSDGHDFAQVALDRGAVALLVERRLDLQVPQILVGSVRSALGPAAAAIHGHPSASMAVVGVTGTNGKTTVSQMVAAMIAAAGHGVEVIGTLDRGLTTPEAPDLQRRLRRALDAGVRHAVMEVSSHGLVEHRVDGVEFDVAVFTNLGRDHLDLHGTQEEYFRAKASLFTRLRPRHAVINVDDPHGRLLADTIGPEGVDAVSIDDVEVVSVRTGGSEVRIDGRAVDIPIAGRVNISNALIAWRVARLLDIDVDAALAGLAAMAPVPGRFELVRGVDPGIEAIVDFAHTPDALAQLITDCREMAPERRIVLVFGCGGDRDATKRPEMGAVAVAADQVVITSDNPRSEDPSAIAAAIVAGVPASERDRCTVIVDRREAIASTIAAAGPQDLVVIAGRGHESVQEIAGERVPFSDSAAVAEALGVSP